MEKKASKSMEFEGKTVEAAIEKAIASLGVARNQIIVRVVCEESRGLFGMEGESPAKIKVSLKHKYLEKKPQI